MAETRREGKEGGEGKERHKGKEGQEGRPSEEMKGRNSWSQMEGSAPGLLPYEGEVLRDEAESCCLCSSDSLCNRNMAGEENINTAPECPRPRWFIIVGRNYPHISTNFHTVI